VGNRRVAKWGRDCCASNQMKIRYRLNNHWPEDRVLDCLHFQDYGKQITVYSLRLAHCGF
jgi:hypothetical protein